MSAELVPIDGIEWCPKHQGVRNEDAERCDMFDAFDCPGEWEDEDAHDEDTCEHCACDLHAVFYVPKAVAS